MEKYYRFNEGIINLFLPWFVQVLEKYEISEEMILDGINTNVRGTSVRVNRASQKTAAVLTCAA